jgi:hypothetical protein
MPSKLQYYKIFNDIITDDDIEELKKSKYNGLELFENMNNNYENTTSVFFDMSILPKNIIKLDINHNYANINNIPSHIKCLYLTSGNNFINIPSTVKELYIKTKYYNKFPEILNIIPYGVKNFTFQVRIFDENEIYNFNMLPDSIIKIIIKNPYEKKNKFIINKIFPNLKNIEYHNFINDYDEAVDFNLEIIDKELYDYIKNNDINLYVGY